MASRASRISPICTIAYVDESDERALETALTRAARAYEGFLPKAEPGQKFDDRVRRHSSEFIGRRKPSASEIMANLFVPDYLQKNVPIRRRPRVGVSVFARLADGKPFDDSEAAVWHKKGPRGPTSELRTCRLFLFEWCTPANNCEQPLDLIFGPVFAISVPY
jgi:hypothetical protein